MRDLGDFHAKGYQVLRDFVPKPVVEAVGGFLNQSLADVQTMLQKQGVLSCDDAGASVAAALAGATSEADKSLLTGHFPLETRLSERLWDIPKVAEVRESLAAVLGCEQISMHMPPVARFILPGNTHAGVPVHQDVRYNHHMSKFVVLWVPLVDIDEQCGGMEFYEGQDRFHELPISDGVGTWLGQADVTGWTPAPLPRLRPGDAVILDAWVPHRSMANVSTRTRLSLDFRFFPADQPTNKHKLDMSTWTVVPPAAA